jgi:hypothetical protein
MDVIDLVNSDGTNSKPSNKNEGKAIWPEAAVLALLCFLCDNKEALKALSTSRGGASNKKNPFWVCVSKHLESLNHHYSPDQCFNKWKNLKKKDLVY